jgi:hypothetical protein
MERDDGVLIDLNAADDRARAAFRRRRTLTMGLSGVAVLAAIAGGGLIVQSMRTTGGDVAALPTAPRSTATVEVTLDPTTPAPAPTPAPTTPASQPRTTAPVEPAPPPPPPPTTPTTLDLRVTAPSNVTMQSDGTIYRGQFTVTIANVGTPMPNGIMGVRVSWPIGVQIDWQAGDPGFANCLTTSPPGWWICAGPSIPAGGSVTKTVHLTASYAPLSSPMTIKGLMIVYNPVNDLTPNDNVVSVTLELPAAN